MIRNNLQTSGISLQSPPQRAQRARGRVREGEDASVNFPPQPSSLQPPASSLSSRRGFTLTELLVVISIIGMLAGMSLGALYSARETARVQKTKGTITKLDRIIQERYAEFMSRRIPISARRLPGTNRPVPPAMMAELRLQVLREIIRMEMPERLTDITYPRVDPTNANRSLADIDATFVVSVSGSVGGTPYTVSETVSRPSLNRRFFRKIYDYAAADGSLLITGTHSPAELLYLVVMSDTEARERFQENEIGDADEDGFFEFHDAWGMPIYYLRWPVHATSDLQSGDPVDDHDPFDSRKIDKDAWRLVPMIYSGGPDKTRGLHTDSPSSPWVFQYGITDTAVGRLYTHLDAKDIGHYHTAPNPEADAAFDNIHNHSLGMN